MENKIIVTRGSNEECLVKCLIEIDKLWEERLHFKNISEATISG